MGLLLAAGAAGGAALSESRRSADAAEAASREAQAAGFSALMASSYLEIVSNAERSALDGDDPAHTARETALRNQAQAQATRLTRETEQHSRLQDGRVADRRAHAAAATWLGALAAGLLAAAAWCAAAGWRRAPAGAAALALVVAGMAWAAWPLLARMFG